MIEHFFSSILLLFLIIDPIGMVPIFLQFTESLTHKERRTVALKATLYSGALLLFFGVFGEGLFQSLGIETTTVQLTGGILLFKISLDMLFDIRNERRRKNSNASRPSASERKELMDRLAISPFAIPLIAGPGSITALIVLLAEQPTTFSVQAGLDLAALLLVLGMLFICLALGSTLLRVFGSNFFTLISRLLGMMLAILAVQIVINALPDFWFTG